MVAATSFIGRTHELALIAALFARGERLVTLLGPGGIGKTRLARRYAGDPAIVCDLAEATTAAAMCEVLCDALDVTLGPRATLEAAIDPIGHVLAARGEVVVVLDNFEQLVESGAHALPRWLGLAPAARLLVTSRERLQLTREVVLDVRPLELVTDAVALFAAPGHHDIVSDTFDSSDTPGRASIDLAPNQRYWLYQDHDNDFGSITSKLSWIDEREAKEMVATCEYKVVVATPAHEPLPAPVPFAPAI